MSDIQELIHKTSMDCLQKGQQMEQERIIKLLEEFIDNCDLPEVVDRFEWFKDALIKEEK